MTDLLIDGIFCGCQDRSENHRHDYNDHKLSSTILTATDAASVKRWDEMDGPLDAPSTKILTSKETECIIFADSCKDNKRLRSLRAHLLVHW